VGYIMWVILAFVGLFAGYKTTTTGEATNKTYATGVESANNVRNINQLPRLHKPDSDRLRWDVGFRESRQTSSDPCPRVWTVTNIFC